MKRSAFIAWTLVLAAAGTWAGRAAWRAHKNIVTLHIRNVPLAEVISSLKRQTWETIVADSRLDTKVTLDVDDMPLVQVLDRIGEQAGGLLTTIHAVYDSRTAMEKLLAALRSGNISNATTWTNLAPNFAFFHGGPGPEEMKLDRLPPGGDHGNRQVVTFDRKVVVRRNGNNDDKTGSEDSGPIIRFRGVGNGDGESVHEEIITPERIVMESRLGTRLKLDAPLAPDLKGAQTVARLVEGKCSTLYALQKSFAAALGGDVMRRFRPGVPRPGSTSALGGRVEELHEPPSMETVERDARRADISRFQNLTPEQRAQRGRERQERRGQTGQQQENP